MYKAGLTVGAAVIAASLFIQPLSGQGPAGQAPGAGRGGGQGRGGPGGPGGRGGAPQQNLPASPTAVTLPTMTEITGPGPMYDSAPSQPAGKGLDFYKYVAKEYYISGTANGQPYKTRMVVRMPADRARFSGLVLMESMHGLAWNQRGAYRDGKFDEKAAREANEAVSAIRKQMFENSLEAQKRVEGVLTAKQREEWRGGRE